MKTKHIQKIYKNSIFKSILCLKMETYIKVHVLLL